MEPEKKLRLIFLPPSLVYQRRHLPRDRYAIRYEDGEVVTLTQIQGALMLALMGNRLVTKEIAMEVAWPDPDMMPDMWHWNLICHFTHIRRKLRRGGWLLVNKHGWGWSLARIGTPEAMAWERRYSHINRIEAA